MNESINQSANQIREEWLIDEQLIKWMIQLVNLLFGESLEWTSEWRNKWMNECINEWMNEWMNERMKEWMNEWMNEWTNE